MTLLFHPEASAEVDEAVTYYQGKDPKVARNFLVELDQQLVRIETTPEQLPAFRQGTQRALLHRFPYQVIFQVEGNLVVVYSVSRQSRRPDYCSTDSSFSLNRSLNCAPPLSLKNIPQSTGQRAPNFSQQDGTAFHDTSPEAIGYRVSGSIPVFMQTLLGPARPRMVLAVGWSG